MPRVGDVRRFRGVSYRLAPLTGPCTPARSRREGIRCRTLDGVKWLLVPIEPSAPAAPKPSRAKKRAKVPKRVRPKARRARATPELATPLSAPLARALSVRARPPAQSGPARATTTARLPAPSSWAPPATAVDVEPASKRRARRARTRPNLALPWVGWALTAAALGWAVTTRRRSADSSPPPLPLPRPPPAPTTLAPSVTATVPPNSLQPLEPIAPEPEPVPEVPPEAAPKPNPPVPTAVRGYRRAKQSEVTSAMVRSAIDTLRASKARARGLGWATAHACPRTGPTPCGDVARFTDPETGQRYAVLIEEHYHEPGGPVRPWGKHPGGSVFIQNESA